MKTIIIKMKNFSFKIIPVFIVTLGFAVSGLSQKSPLLAEPAFENLRQFLNVRDFTMNEIGDEAYFSVQSPLGEISAIATMKKTRGKWRNPEMVKFSGKYKDLEPFLSPDGLKLYFVSNRPLNDSTEKVKDTDIWYVRRDNSKSDWSNPINLGSPINTVDDEFYPSVASNGNFYFTKEKEGANKKPDIMLSNWDGKNYAKPVALSDAINTDQDEFNAFVAPDESFILFGGWRREDGFGSGDIYISFRNSDGTWKKAENLGKDINSASMDYCPFVDWKTKTLYFTSRRSLVEIKSFSSLKDFENETDKYENGLSRIYKISIADKLLKF